MIKATITKNRLTVSGHAGYAPKGQDIVCAAVSALVYALVATLEEADNISETVIRPGYMTVAAMNEDRAFDVVRNGLTQIVARYPDYVSLEVDNEHL